MLGPKNKLTTESNKLSADLCGQAAQGLNLKASQEHSELHKAERNTEAQRVTPGKVEIFFLSLYRKRKKCVISHPAKPNVENQIQKSEEN